MSAAQTPTIIVVDAMELRRACIISLLEPWAEAGGLQLASLTPEEAPRKLDGDHPCRMLIVNLGGQSVCRQENLQILKVLHALAIDIPLVIVADSADPEDVAAALLLGAQGFVPTEMSPELAIQAFSFILSGGSSPHPPCANYAASQRRIAVHPIKPRCQSLSKSACEPTNRTVEDNDARSSSLTTRQKAVLEHLCQGEPNKLIARRLGMTEGTVKVHVRQIMRKLGAANRTQAAVCAMGPDPVGIKKRQ